MAGGWVARIEWRQQHGGRNGIAKCQPSPRSSPRHSILSFCFGTGAILHKQEGEQTQNGESACVRAVARPKGRATDGQVEMSTQHEDTNAVLSAELEDEEEHGKHESTCPSVPVGNKKS
jgi:hypothetical protein